MDLARQNGEWMSDPDLVHILIELGVAVMERNADGTFTMVGRMPAWLARMFPGWAGDSPLAIQQSIPLLGSFLPDAEDFWAGKAEGRLRSGLYAEIDESGGEYHFEVSALCVGERRLLLFELRKDFDETREILQRARQNLLDYELLDRTKRALERSQEELRKATDAAEAATQAKSAFLAHMSHEIRTPMNAILGLTGLLLNSSLEERQREFLEIVRNSGETLLTILSDILDFSKIESGKLELERQPFDIRRCLEDTLDLFAVRAAEKRLELSYSCAPDVPFQVVGDVTRLRQIIVNLVGNALKFTKAGEISVSVSARRQDGGAWELRVAVKDTGIGIPPDRRDRLFQSFSQVDPSVTRKYGGTGLGLAICKSLAELMGGRMCVESEAGRGSTFQFTIVAGASETVAPAYLSRIQPELAGKRIWIVGSTATNRRNLQELLEQWGMLTKATESIAEVESWRAEGNSCEAAILDLPPEVSDWHAIPQPWLELTQGGRLESADARAGVRARVNKPIKPANLHAVMLDLFRGKTGRDRQEVASAPSHLTGMVHTVRILLADDGVINQKVGSWILESLGYRADVAGSGLEVLQALTRQPYDVVLMDVQMSEMDGWETSRRIRRELPADRQPRIIAMTANVTEDNRQKCLDAGMDDFVGKPVRAEELGAALRRYAESVSVPSRAEEARKPERKQLEGFDPAVVEALRRMGKPGQPDVFSQLLVVFKDMLPGQLAQMRQAVVENQPDVLKHLSHKLRGGSANIGARTIALLCARLEALGEEQKLEGAAPILDELESAIKTCSSVCSVNGYVGDARAALNLGADQRLTKPAPPDQTPATEGEPAGELGEGQPCPMAFRVRFWGTRGSVATPGPRTLRYGGNTSCTEVRLGNHILVLDAGTGIRELGDALISEFQGNPIRAHIFVGHIHWDHIQGFPFFTPAYLPGNEISLYSPRGAGKSLRRIFLGQLDSDYLPVLLSDMRSTLTFVELSEPVQIGPITVRFNHLNHPGVANGLRIVAGAKVIVYLSDHECFSRMYGEAAGGVEDQRIAEFARSADLLISEAQYTVEEYRSKRGWGHSTFDDALRLAGEAGAKQLAIFHHDPAHDDAFMDRVIDECREKVLKAGYTFKCFAAREGETITV